MKNIERIRAFPNNYFQLHLINLIIEKTVLFLMIMIKKKKNWKETTRFSWNLTILGFQLLDQLVPGGRMVMPIGEPFKGQNLTIIDKLADGYTIVTTVVRTVRTNPLYRDRFQQKKYYTELRWVFVCTPYNILVMQSAMFLMSESVIFPSNYV